MMSKLSEIVYSVVVMVCLTWAIYTVAVNYAPKTVEKPQIENELIEIKHPAYYEVRPSNICNLHCF